MREIRYTITHPLGLHARPAGELVKAAKGFSCAVTLSCGEKQTDAKRLLAVMGMCVKQGEEIVLTLDGEDEGAAETALTALLREKL